MKVEIDFFDDGVSLSFIQNGDRTQMNYKKENGNYPFDKITDKINNVLKTTVKTEQKF